MRTVLVVLHAAPGVVGLLTGLRALSPPRQADGRAWWRRIYAVCVAVLLAALLVLVGYDWGDLDTTARVVFLGLAGLGAVMATRLVLAYRAAGSTGTGWQERYIDHVYFSYVALWVGFLIVPALSTPWPAVGVPIAVAAPIAAGALLVSRYKRRVLGAT